MPEELTSLTSPGAATAARAERESDALFSATLELEKFLKRLRTASLKQTPPTLGEVLGSWAKVVDVLARDLGGPDPQERQIVRQRLLASTVPLKAHSTAVATLAYARGERMSKAATRREMYEALDPATGTWERSADGLELRGTSWQAALDALVRTEATAAQGRESLAALAEAGYGAKMWVARVDTHTRPTHMEANGQSVSLVQDFLVGGYRLAYPGDPQGPPSEIYNCRCVLVAAGTPPETPDERLARQLPSWGDTDDDEFPVPAAEPPLAEPEPVIPAGPDFEATSPKADAEVPRLPEVPVPPSAPAPEPEVPPRAAPITPSTALERALDGEMGDFEREFEGVLNSLKLEGVSFDAPTYESNYSSFKAMVTLTNSRTGEYVGEVIRRFEKYNDKPAVKHDLFQLEPDYQGQGIASAFNRAMESQYRRWGITDIRLNANIDVGGYTWAKAGYDWDYEAMGEGVYVRSLLESFADQGDPQIIAWLRAVDDGDVENWPLPYDLAMKGWSEEARTWEGKEVMLKSSWMGVKNLLKNPPSPEPVAVKVITPTQVDRDVVDDDEGLLYDWLLPSVLGSQDAETLRGVLRESVLDNLNSADPDVQFKVDGVTFENGGAVVKITISDASGNPIGNATRVFSEKGGRGSVNHDLLNILPDYQGKGIASRFNRQMELLYRQMDVSEITLNANIDVGGYAWAKAGYDWDHSQMNNVFILDMLDAFEDQEDPQIKAWTETVTNGPEDQWPLPYDLAMKGWTEGAKEWEGKEIMLQTSWYGVKKL